jgi:hypothetical protein
MLWWEINGPNSVRRRWSAVGFILNSVRIKNSRQNKMTRHYDHAFRNCTEISSSHFEEPVGIGVKVGNVCAEGRWFGTAVGQVGHLYFLNSTSSFLVRCF